MKKIIVLLVVFALFAGAAFGQAEGFYSNAWGRATFLPLVNVGAEQKDGSAVADSKAENYTGAGVTWGGTPRVDIRFGYDSEMVGFKIHMTADGGSIGTGDDAHIWAKPFGNDILKIMVGKYIEDALRGKVGDLDGGFGAFIGIGTGDEDAIFTRFAAGGASGTPGDKNGIILSSSPIDGLFIGLQVRGNLGPVSTDGPWAGLPYTNTAFQMLQLGVGYNIAGIGHARAQYFGGWSGELDPTDADKTKYWDSLTSPTAPKIQIAFGLTAIDGLLLDLGATINMAQKMKGSGAEKTGGMAFSLGANFNSGIIGVGARADMSGLGAYTRTDKDKKNEDGMMMAVRVVPSFDLDFAKVVLDVGFESKSEDKGDDGAGKGNQYTKLGFGAFLEKGLGKGSFKAGAAYALPKNGKDGANGAGVFSIPIILEYAFF